jgi:hypothetical protein
MDLGITVWDNQGEGENPMNDLLQNDTADFLYATGLTRVQLQRLEEAGALVPVVRGRRGNARPSRWTCLQAVGAGLARAFSDCGLHPSWGHAACQWVSRQRPGALETELAKGHTFLVLGPDGTGKLVKPNPQGNPANRLRYALLDLRKIYLRVMGRLWDTCPEPQRSAFREAHKVMFELTERLAAARAAAAEGKG